MCDKWFDYKGVSYHISNSEFKAGCEYQSKMNQENIDALGRKLIKKSMEMSVMQMRIDNQRKVIKKLERLTSDSRNKTHGDNIN